MDVIRTALFVLTSVISVSAIVFFFSTWWQHRKIDKEKERNLKTMAKGNTVKTTGYTTLYLDDKEGPCRVQGIELWHPINGVWTHIVQQVENGETLYYTNGVQEKF